ncbi:ras GTPase-activating protein 4-like isoform X2 [Xenia sp. Carnegie-2017]|uniref:ras GTPase-activating protein 4-like isoform X2 n=1 Tax=Xenia sp. Carnegie-2017 TaxID=2897299 RepID=UPI001F0341A3|nr:ras GTPase-activating protein 4-like isoform X2 [Xenia sp. Carnegie-2017]
MLKFLTTLELTVSECKNLPSKDIFGKSDPYCLVKIDNHVMASGDNIIGKVALSRQDMLSLSPNSGEVWYTLNQVDNVSEVHGELHLKILATRISEKQTSISVQVVEARNLGMKRKHVSDPFVKIRLKSKHEGGNETRPRSETMDTKEQRIQTSVRRTSCPFWNSSIVLICTTPLSEQYICAEVYDKERVIQNFLIGEVMLDLGTIVIDEMVDQWYRLTPSNMIKSKNDLKKKDLGKIRLKIGLLEETILPLKCYIPLVNLLMDTVKTSYENVNVLSLLEQVMTADRTSIGRSLVKLYLSQGMIVDLLDLLTKTEVMNTETLNTLFRGNSLATKALDEFMKVIGLPYLLETLKPIIDKIYKEKRYCEIDPNKIDRTMMRRRSIFQIDDAAVRQRSVTYLKLNLMAILNAILHSKDNCPYIMKQVFRNLYHNAAQRFTENEENGKYVAISSFLFLRFFVPAILNPKLFGVAENHPDKVVSRTLTLLAKVLQSIGNFNPCVVKEPWMMPFSDFIEENAAKLKTFIDNLVGIPDNRRESLRSETPLLIKEGQLKKCKLGGKLNTFQWKKYTFSIFGDSIHYSKKYDSQTRKFLMASRLIAVEQVEDIVFDKSNVFQVIMKNSAEDGGRDIHYLLAKDVKEMNQWISAIRRIIPSENKPMDEYKKYHRGIFNGQYWNCCKSPLQKDSGCSLIHSMASLNDYQDPVFPEQQAQIIYKQFLLGREKLKDILIEHVRLQNQLPDLTKDEILSRIYDGGWRVSSDSGCDMENDEEGLLTCDFSMDNVARTIVNVLSIVDVLELKHREHMSEDYEKDSIESEDEVFSSCLAPTFKEKRNSLPDTTKYQ